MEYEMTCIVGFSLKGKVYIGADSAGIGEWDLTIRTDPKVFRNGPAIFGFTSSFRMGDLLRYALVIPERHPDEDIDRWMRTGFVDAVRNCLKAGGFAEKEKETEKGGQFLVGYEGRLFYVGSDYQIGEAVDGYDAVGCGDAYAKGAMAAMINLVPDIAPAQMIEYALQITERNCAGVRAPFTVVTL
jgi:ATP-dependent protease HslVU (ClpYQ) peptidase subunit